MSIVQSAYRLRSMVRSLPSTMCKGSTARFLPALSIQREHSSWKFSANTTYGSLCCQLRRLPPHGSSMKSQRSRTQRRSMVGTGSHLRWLGPQ